MTAAMWGTDPTDPPGCRLAEWSTKFGCPGDQSTTGGYSKRVNCVRWPIRMLFNRMKHDWVGCCTRSSPPTVTITGTEYSRPTYSNLWFNTVRCKLFVFLLPSLFFKENKSRMLCGVRWRPTAGRRTSNALIPNVGDKAVSAEVQATFVMMKNLCVRKQDTEREREIEIGTKETLYFNSNSYKWQPTLTEIYKVALYSDYLRATALYAIYRNSPNMGCPKEQCEYGHYTLIFDTRNQPSG